MLIIFLFLSTLLIPYAHSDVMNLNEYMPSRLEDASPMDVNKIEIQTSGSFEENEKQDRVTFLPNFRYGASKKLQLETLAHFYSGGDEQESGETSVGGLYQLNNPSGAAPMISISPFVVLPTGKNSEGEDTEAKLLLSSTLRGTPESPETQVHLNVNHYYQDRIHAEQRRNRGMILLGLSHRLSENTSIVADIYREELTKEEEESNVAELGMVQAFGSGYQVGASLGAGIGDESPSWTASLGLQKQL